jgi:dipeptidyl-peptidase-4
MLKNKATLFILILLLGFTSFAQDQLITLDDIHTKHLFNAKRVHGLRSMHNGNYYTVISQSEAGQSIIKFSYTNGDTVETIFSTTDLDQSFKFSEYQFSADESKILFTTEEEAIYRHSTREHVWIYDLKKSELTQISKNGKQRYTTFSPDGKKVAFVRSNNLYTYDLKSKKETTVTSDGEFNKIINGATDWVYEEEFGFDKAFTWSPDNMNIAYYKFNESNVKEFNMIMYQSALYPTDYRFKYPKAGEENSQVDIYIYNLKKEESIKANFPQTEYVPRIKWATQNDLAIQTLNRLQNDLTIHFVNPKTNDSHVVYHEISDTYVEVINNWYFLPDTRKMIITSEKDGYKHIYSINYMSGLEQQVTKGKWDITNFYGVMEQSENIYYQSAEEGPTQRHIYKIDLKDNSATKLSKETGWNDAAFSKSFLFYINTHSNANTPYTTTLNLENGTQLALLVDNKKLEKTIAQFKISSKEFITVPTSYGTDLNGWMIKPADFDPNKKYPVLVTIYGGPGSQTVKDSWDYNMMWHHMLAQKGYIVVSVDNRGTGARGAEFKKVTYQQLGKLEVEDYIETAKFLGSQSFVDPSRIGIWGWSYGGYMSTLALSKGADYYKAAIAVAPVTNWRYYDNIYTERYMRTPQENASGYDDNSPINFVEKIKGNYLLVHGTADDNVHFQNTAELVSALVNANIQYDFYMYTDKNHSIYGGNTRKHLFTKFTNFLLEKL